MATFAEVLHMMAELQEQSGAGDVDLVLTVTSGDAQRGVVPTSVISAPAPEGLLTLEERGRYYAQASQLLDFLKKDAEARRRKGAYWAFREDGHLIRAKGWVLDAQKITGRDEEGN